MVKVLLAVVLALGAVSCVGQQGPVKTAEQDFAFCLADDVALAVKKFECGIKPTAADLLEKVEKCAANAAVKTLLGASPCDDLASKK